MNNCFSIFKAKFYFILCELMGHSFFYEKFEYKIVVSLVTDSV